MPRSLVLVVALTSLALSPGCRKKGPPPIKMSAEDQALSRFALSVLEAARSPGGLGPELVDDDLVERLRRVQLVKHTTMDTMDRDKLLAAFAGEAGPDRKYPVAERPAKQRERAARGMNAMLTGTCTAIPWPEGRAARVAFFVAPVDAGPLPDEVRTEQKALGERLAKAEVARVSCQSGEAGFVVVKDGSGKRRLVDAFPLHRATMEVHPNEPTMK